MKRTDIVYKFNKHQPVNGSLFYAFEYLIKLIEETTQNIRPGDLRLIKKNDLPRLYIICNRSFKVELKEKLLNLFIGRYPITKSTTDSFLVNNFYNQEFKRKLTKEKYQEIMDIKKLVTVAFNQITPVTQPEYLKAMKKTGTTIFVSLNTFLINMNMVKFFGDDHQLIVFQNRLNTTNDIKTLNFTLLPKATYLYETPNQWIPLNPNNQYQYSLKLGFKYFYPIELFKTRVYAKNNIMVSGRDIPDHQENIKPTRFLATNQRYFFFDGITHLKYYRNLNICFDENNRIIPEARFYKFKVNIITMAPSILPAPTVDSTFGRSTFDLELYNLEHDNITELCSNWNKE